MKTPEELEALEQAALQKNKDRINLVLALTSQVGELTTNNTTLTSTVGQLQERVTELENSGADPATVLRLQTDLNTANAALSASDANLTKVSALLEELSTAVIDAPPASGDTGAGGTPPAVVPPADGTPPADAPADPAPATGDTPDATPAG